MEIFNLLKQQINESKDNLGRAAKFFEQPQIILGTVSAGSGLKTVQPHTSGEGYPNELDWSIISIDRNCSISNKVRCAGSGGSGSGGARKGGAHKRDAHRVSFSST
ncbi:hypothetical protein N7533_007600 [Penicillium manginii]|uniref:uncharacterized protein n=1 Tax=Penicillium manginii TaxID=203109 RepID=UPI0025468A5C|nr:uncharacterized protein N7533_007600 [Penicillium manginii]KAJ5750572.1 hypothetical protein N7533_007600 [Penicillium manginii]